MITRVGAASASGATVTIPAGHTAGDLMIIFAYRDDSATNPTIPAGWTTITATLDQGITGSVAIGYKFATSAAETSGTWTSALGTVVVVYRGTLAAPATPVGTFQSTTSLSGTATYPATALATSGYTGGSWFMAFGASNSIDSTIETPPTGMVNVTNTVTAAVEVVAHDTNGLATANWPSTTVTINGTSTNWITVVMEVKDGGVSSKMEDYKFPRVLGGSNVLGVSVA